MKPKPFSALNHFTLPCATCAPTFVRRTTPLDRGAGSEALPPVEHERGTRTARKATTRTPAIHRIHAESRRSGDRSSRPTSADETGRPRRLQRRVHPVGGPDDRLERVEGLQPLAGVEDDGLLRGVKPAVLDELAEDRHGHPAGRLREDTRRAREVADA